MIELHSLPESLKNQIRQIAEELVASPNGQFARPQDQSYLLEVARQNAMLFVAMALADSGITSIEIVETDETRVDQVVQMRMTSTWVKTEVVPMVTRKTKRRTIRLERNR